MERDALIERLTQLTYERERLKIKIQEIANYSTLRGEIDTATALINVLNNMKSKNNEKE